MSNIILIENTYPDSASLSSVLNYIFRSGIIGGYALDPQNAYHQMMMVKRAFHKEDGVQLKHFVVSFSTAEMYRYDTDDLLRLGFEIGQLFQEYQLAYAIHYDTEHIHLHCVMNTVSFVDGHKYSGGLSLFWALRKKLERRFPRSDVGIYRSLPNSSLNRYSNTNEDYLLRIG